MTLEPLFTAIDAQPFKPFVLELILPSRQAVHHIEVFDPGGWLSALIWPEGINAVLFSGKTARSK